MDPQQTLVDLLEALYNRDCDTAEDCCEVLRDWINKGGVLPVSHRVYRKGRADYYTNDTGDE